ncbi:thymidylate synthase (FAD) [Corynebacterium sp. 13CS0277]|uniref:FAD-dependent thymidylate synthase n=1 Tax=Corynebacterium sp. 13CS0277 TaxID=2071994 RepID=UPI000D02B968|nr:FAD-dependent thymidylate synthase [Corynebacterium sp. 13CS0277]PRQ12629.1 thymidylate synthase (FAD) [Corynebacterium sp. 13CS0277]
MSQHVDLQVQLVAATEFHTPPTVDFSTDATGGQALIEFAGRACYETFHKPNPRTASNEAYIHHIMEVGHLALLEHASATMYLTGISRAATQELVRHRHFSFSQLSQRFVHSEDTNVVIPPAIRQDEALLRLFEQAVDDTRFAYQELLDALEAKYEDEPNALLRRKQARQAARAILPNATESRIVVTGNYRAWRHFIGMRATEHADVEIRTVAVECLKLLQEVAPAVFGDFVISTLADGSEMATSPYVLDF